jgi:hypothetical protein
MEFSWWNRGGSAPIGSAVIGPQGNGSEFTTTIPAGKFADGQQLSWHAHAGDGWTSGPWSGWCQINIDNTAPGAPAVTPDPSQPPTVGAPATFTVRANDNDVTGFRYGLTQGGTVCAAPNSVNASALGGSATVKVTPLKATTWDLWVAAVDRAGNITASTACAHYRFQVQPGRPEVAHWALDGNANLTAVPDSSGNRHDGTVALGPSSWTFGRVGDALHFDGTSGSYVAPSGGSVVRTDQSFSVSAWVKLDQADSATHAAVSQDGSSVHGFMLGYFGEYRRFGFRMLTQDSVGSNFQYMVMVPATGAPEVGVWTHLTGVYDSVNHEMRLYVNGVLQGTAAMNMSWNAGNGVQLGRVKYGGGYVDGWLGAIDDVRIYDRVLSDLPYLEPGESAPRGEIARLAAPPIEEAYYPLDEGPGTRTGDTSGNYRTATLGGAATLSSAGHIGGSLQLGSAASGFAATAGQVVRTDQSFTVAAWVKRDVSDTGTRAAVSQDGTSGHGFLLGYISEHGTFAFRMVTQSGQMPSVPASSAAQTGVWTHLAGTYDAATQQLRLYVNGVLQGTATMPAPWNAPGALQIGRSRWGGSYTDPWVGAIDEVHLYSGVLPDPEIAALSGQTAPRPPSLFAGTFERYAGHDQRHFTGSGPVPPGYHLEASLGYAAPAGAPDTRMIYSCRGASGYFLDPAADCGGIGSEVLGQAGLMYATQPADVPTWPVYRCLVLSSGERFASVNSACEGTPDRVRTEFVLGYTRLLTPLIRYRGPGGVHWTSSHGQLLPAGYAPEERLGLVSMGGIGPAPMLRMCRDGTDEYLSTDAACDGGQDMNTWGSGWVWPDPPAGVTESAPLYACRSAEGERFESLDDFCEGGTLISRLGYVIARP